MKRAAFLEHVGWTGAGIAYTFGASGLLTGTALAEAPAAVEFVQISDSHIGFHQAANPDVAGTLTAVVDGINGMPSPPAFVVHTGDITHLSTAQQFDDAKQILSRLRVPLIALPGEHDVVGNDPKAYLSHFKIDGSGADGWASWDRNGIHYVALLNVFNFEKNGVIGSDQLAWLGRDLTSVRSSTPVVVFTHVPLYALYPDWGWTTADGAQALALLRKFDRVTVLNGHIHQIVTHEDGNIRFASAAATAYPQPKPGTAPKPGPVTLEHGDLLHAIGYRTVQLDAAGSRLQEHPLA